MSTLFPYRLIATDLDGTLLREDQTVSRRTRDALAAATAAGASRVRCETDSSERRSVPSRSVAISL